MKTDMQKKAKTLVDAFVSGLVELIQEGRDSGVVAVSNGAKHLSKKPVPVILKVRNSPKGTPAQKLQGRYLGLLNRAGKGSRLNAQAKALRAKKGVKEAIAFLESKAK